MNEEIIARAAEIVQKNTGAGTHCVLALIDLDGCPTASTITVSKADGIRSMTFCTGLGDRTRRIEKCPCASICFTSEEYNITLKGSMEVLTDTQAKKDFWYGGMENHFSGPDDPNYCVLRFQTKSYNLLVDWKEAKGTL